MRRFILFFLIVVMLSACNEKTNYQEFIVMGPSMEPTFKDGQIIKVDETYYDTNEIKRNDLIYFYNKQNNLKYVKRILGLPNEEINIMKDSILIEGVEILLPVKIIDNPYVGKYKTGLNEYFVIGDNYSDSLDSRMGGPIEKEQIIGKVIE
ncbi:signal peptidase I [Paenibacillus wynnii]|uniref:Signal peptidase I n=1 Tax=Paenibacillus wynnii TaxID=268407 RepID=A0A098M473_9BACL|nr:signal peptidase I [Paenibacillus wynnii]KGE16823.1 hypothetical protein PWYN_19225 [Paenibacillus wynnii]